MNRRDVIDAERPSRNRSALAKLNELTGLNRLNWDQFGKFRGLRPNQSRNHKRTAN